MTNHTVSGWQKASTVATYLQVVIVALSAWLIWSQLRQHRLSLDQQVKLNRAANTQTLVSLMTPLNLRRTDREIAELYVKGAEGIEKIPDEHERDIQRERYESLLASNMIFYENVYSQYDAGLLDQKIYDGWDKDLAVFIEAHQIAKHWDEWKDLYRKDFSDHVSQIIASQKQKNAATPGN